MKSLNKIVDSFSGQVMKEVKVSYYIQSKIVPLWNEILGKLALEFHFEHVRYRQLYMSTANPIWKTEIKYHEAMIIKRLNDRLPKSLYFKGIRVFYKAKNESLMASNLNKSKGVNGPLFERIQQENQRKQALGASYCEKCSAVLTLDSICVFCRLQ